ncbi:GNAT family N-acetyltransferase [Streptomyces sp. MUM 203J]|uniref:GNAT family N-acetyltransferase n=1 Tax=Streptomyces sp. MUM 203J TaxID=2791990 RepID=UPI001F038A81|nr:GNAT family protein [Streptomyces sp. MUM 203J]MCH0542799.1 GNAT family N-acetyltransferase [Streptomyces sp. MUM 203J]
MTSDDPYVIRPADPSRDAPALAAALARNRAAMRPFEPHRADAYYTAEGQAERLSAPGCFMWLVLEGGRVVGSATLSGIVLGAFRSCSLGYWTDEEHRGRGLAPRMVEAACRGARDGLGLHRVQAGTLLGNTASQRVLEKCGFEPIGVAPRYLGIDGAWRDHRLFQRILHDDPPKSSTWPEQGPHRGDRGSGDRPGRAP